jgi:hypothetical protein
MWEPLQSSREEQEERTGIIPGTSPVTGLSLWATGSTLLHHWRLLLALKKYVSRRCLQSAVMEDGHWCLLWQVLQGLQSDATHIKQKVKLRDVEDPKALCRAVLPLPVLCTMSVHVQRTPVFTSIRCWKELLRKL